LNKRKERRFAWQTAALGASAARLLHLPRGTMRFFFFLDLTFTLGVAIFYTELRIGNHE